MKIGTIYQSKEYCKYAKRDKQYAFLGTAHIDDFGDVMGFAFVDFNPFRRQIEICAVHILLFKNFPKYMPTTESVPHIECTQFRINWYNNCCYVPVDCRSEYYDWGAKKLNIPRREMFHHHDVMRFVKPFIHWYKNE